jgi:hypothetical protein
MFVASAPEKTTETRTVVPSNSAASPSGMSFTAAFDAQYTVLPRNRQESSHAGQVDYVRFESQSQVRKERSDHEQRAITFMTAISPNVSEQAFQSRIPFTQGIDVALWIRRPGGCRRLEIR